MPPPPNYTLGGASLGRFAFKVTPPCRKTCRKNEEMPDESYQFRLQKGEKYEKSNIFQDSQRIRAA